MKRIINPQGVDITHLVTKNTGSCMFNCGIGKNTATTIKTTQIRIEDTPLGQRDRKNNLCVGKMTASKSLYTTE